MKMADILRSMADKLDQIERGSSHRLEPVQVDEPELDPSPVMIPPLQQKLELLKKATGVESEFDCDDEQPDELDDIRKLTGIRAVIHQEAGEDNDVLG